MVSKPPAHLGPRVGLSGVDELGTLLDRVLAEVASGPHPPADPISHFQHGDVEPGARTLPCRGHAGHARPDHHHVEHEEGDGTVPRHED